METIGETIGVFVWLIFILIFGTWVGMIMNTYYIRQILSELKKLNQSTPSEPKTIPIKIPPKPSLMYCSNCDTGFKADRTACPKCGGTNRYLKNE
jgi:Zn finger protein HypA/HybF involved in hydrogenase expression